MIFYWFITFHVSHSEQDLLVSHISLVLFSETLVYLYSVSQSHFCVEILFRFVIYCGDLYK